MGFNYYFSKMIRGLLIILLVLINLRSFSQYNPDVHGVPEIEYKALVAFYNAMNGDNWYHHDNWLSDYPVSSWYGVTVEEGRVTKINVGNFSIEGTLPDEFFNLTELKELNLMLASLKGKFPVLITNLKNLEVLDLMNGDFTGGFPLEIDQMTNLKELYLCGNFNGGPMPDLSNMTNLRVLQLSCNFNGQIPEWVGDLSNLTILDLSYNSFTGTIPQEIVNLTNLKWLYLSYNDFNAGPMPDLSGLKKLNILSVANCNFTGTIPSWIDELNQLRTIDLRGNKFTGRIPTELSNITSLQEIYIQSDYFDSQSFPDFSQLSNLSLLSLSGCNLVGEIPDWLTQLSQLYRLYLSNNSLNGDISEFIGNFTHIGELMLEENQLTGEIPVNIENLTNLKYLYLNNNKISGIIPSQLFSLPKLIACYLDHNLIDSIDYPDDLNCHLYLRFQNNKLEFDDIIPVIRNNTWKSVYSPQDTIGIKTDTVIYVGSNYLLDINSQYQGNIFQWFRNGIPINSPSTNSSFSIQNITEDDAGIYTCDVTNPSAPDLTLHSYPVTLSIKECIAQSDSVDVSICKGESYENHTVPGVYTDSLVNMNGCDSIVTTRLTVFPENKTTITRFADTLRCDRSYQEYFWYFNDQLVEDIDSFRLDIDKSGNYYVIGLDENGCLNQSETIFIIPTGKNDIINPEKYFSVYPNPSNGEVKIQADNSMFPVDICISDFHGNVLLRLKDIGPDELHLNLSSLKKGILFITLSNDKFTQTRKIYLN